MKRAASVSEQVIVKVSVSVSVIVKVSVIVSVAAGACRRRAISVFFCFFCNFSVMKRSASVREQVIVIVKVIVSVIVSVNVKVIYTVFYTNGRWGTPPWFPRCRSSNP